MLRCPMVVAARLESPERDGVVIGTNANRILREQTRQAVLLNPRESLTLPDKDTARVPCSIAVEDPDELWRVAHVKDARRSGPTMPRVGRTA